MYYIISMVCIDAKEPCIFQKRLSIIVLLQNFVHWYSERSALYITQLNIVNAIFALPNEKFPPSNIVNDTSIRLSPRHRNPCICFYFSSAMEFDWRLDNSAAGVFAEKHSDTSFKNSFVQCRCFAIKKSYVSMKFPRFFVLNHSLTISK